MTLRALTLVSILTAVPQAPPARPAPPAAQPAPQSAVAPSAPAQSTKPAEAETPIAAYNPEGRRDPFLSLLGRGPDPHGNAVRVPGMPGLLISEVTVKGILRSPNGYIAMLQAPDNKTYIVHVGDRLMDGAVKNITQDSVIFSQDVNDPLSLVKQREVPKRVRGTEGRG
jgi:Tfp pilus assembly protein PilP